MSKTNLTTCLVVEYDHDSGTFTFDADGTREWIRKLYSPESNTWDSTTGDSVAVPQAVEQKAIQALASLGVTVH